ncbi:transaldolase family protein [Streptomyces turgidiscabies]|uniref:Transaldolase n=1 Tax=Streptomyces turgidiscabies (strain Car8) TaxID=698760 RepID=L7F5S0_STRT8|nr:MULTISPECIES: transaldolase family protein [Streptomyces]ELP66376.1 putative transaldolase [Streptomyces turgidiscabies Car8]MDX3494262.1 transaldolase family protein [Streptomyces turgidiscabies]GAQ68364.1 transaldolase [Streptomyces turgidiscabies]
MSTRPCSAVGGVLNQLTAEGVHLWLDDFHRGQLADGSLRRMVADGLVTGAVSRPAALMRAMTADTGAYGERRPPLSEKHPDEHTGHTACAEERVYGLLAEDARRACALLDPVFRATDGMLGRVSVGVAPSLASDAAALTDRARRLAASVGRPNVLIRVPATPRGLVAAGDLLAGGIGVHVTSVFSVDRYARAVDVYFRGLERATAGGIAASDVSSLVSLDVGTLGARVDSRLAGTADPSVADALRGRAGTATARLVYRRYEESLGCPRWRELVARGARPQRLLWTSEGAADRGDPEPSEDPEISHLIAWMTLHALPQPALEALALNQHGRLRGDTLSGSRAAACAVFDALEQAGVTVESVAHELEQAEHERELTVWGELVTAVAANPGA